MGEAAGSRSGFPTSVSLFFFKQYPQKHGTLPDNEVIIWVDVMTACFYSILYLRAGATLNF